MLDLKLAERPTRFEVQFNQEIFSDFVRCVLLLPQGHDWSFDWSSDAMHWGQQRTADADSALAHRLDTGCLLGHPSGPFTEPDRALEFGMGGTGSTCPFGELVQWLETIMATDHPAAFNWGAEGPGGRMNWFPETADVGVLEINWSRWPCRYFVRTERRNLVSSFYRSFRALVESEHYDPTAYESMSVIRTLGYWITAVNVDDLIEAMVSMDRRNVARLCQAVCTIFSESESPWADRRPLPLAEFLREASQLPYYPRTPLKKRATPLLGDQVSLANELEDCRGKSFRELRKMFSHSVSPTWRNLDIGARKTWATQWFSMNHSRSDGDDLLAIRSEKFEAWLREGEA